MNAVSQLAATLQPILEYQAREVLSKTRLFDDKDVPLQHWLPGLQKAVQPYVLHFCQSGVIQGTYALAGQLRQPLLAAKRGRRMVIKSIGMDFNLGSPFVQQAVDELVFKFCRETNETAVVALRQAKQQLREALKKKVRTKGEAVDLLTKRVLKIFAEPMRARRIADTEYHRAINLGKLLAARESGVVKKKIWRCNANACEKCRALANKKVALDANFAVEPDAGPYALIQHPPYHPRCHCGLDFVVPSGVTFPVFQPVGAAGRGGRAAARRHT